MAAEVTTEGGDMIPISAYDRPDRVQACPYRHTATCDACGFDGEHLVRFEALEGLQVRIHCSCSWRGPIRRNFADAAGDARRHEKRIR